VAARRPIKRLYAIVPQREEFTDVLETITRAAITAIAAIGAAEDVAYEPEVVRSDNFSGPPDLDEVQRHLQTTSMVVADTTGATPEVSFRLGLAQASGKPIVLINQEDQLVPFDLAEYRTLLYDRSRLRSDLRPRLTSAIVNVLRDSEAGPRRREQEEPRDVSRAFVSYSHADSKSLERLLVHLKPLQRMGVVEVWEDTKIKVGDRWEQKISDALSRAAIAVLLISADFLASDFIIDNELPPLLEGAREKGTRILPVILKPCRFARAKNLSQFQAVHVASEPVLSLSPIDQERIWDRVAYAIETEVD